MINSAAMPPAAPVAIIDTLNALLEAERGSMFRFMGEGSPYLSRATAEIRRPLQEMVDTTQRHVMELAELIESLGGYPSDGLNVQPEEQFLAFLSLKFLLPKLVHEKELTIRRYENALASLRDAPAEVKAVLDAHLAEHRAQREILQRAADEVIRASR
jgi:hypothetical protein